MILGVDSASVPLPQYNEMAVHRSMATDAMIYCADDARFPTWAGLEPVASWKTAAAKNFAAIAALLDGWDGHGSGRISRKVIYQGDRLLRDALQSTGELSAPYIIPSADGAIQFEWRTAKHELEFRLGEDQSRSFWLRDRDTGAEIEDQGDAATKLFFRWAQQVAAVSGAADVPPATQAPAPVYLAA